MGIDLRGTHVCMTEQGLHCTDIAATPEQFIGEAVTKRMATHMLANTRTLNGLFDSLLDRADIQVPVIRSRLTGVIDSRSVMRVLLGCEGSWVSHCAHLR